MSAIDPDISSGEDDAGLADELSDVIEEYGRGLDAEAISSAIETVLEDYDNQDSETGLSHDELERELNRFVDTHAGDLERAEILELLREIADELQSGSLEPEINLDDPGAFRVVELEFDCAYALERALSNLFDIRGYFIEADIALTYLDDIRLRIRAARIEETVELEGCVTRTAPNGFTVQVWQPSVEVERRLRNLPSEMRESRR